MTISFPDKKLRLTTDGVQFEFPLKAPHVEELPPAQLLASEDPGNSVFHTELDIKMEEEDMDMDAPDLNIKEEDFDEIPDIDDDMDNDEVKPKGKIGINQTKEFHVIEITISLIGRKLFPLSF